ncbi:MAG: CDGSH iron-sulfur domain-containing protein [Gemmatimonadaceae bacterium]|nr:CDGSH iron-sulfur domain-containing protein [Gemmatimonadaceae bacterium]
MTITIHLREHGPYYIAPDDAAHVRIVDAGGNHLVPPPGRGIVLCRCGHSGQKPFCDKSHKRFAPEPPGDRDPVTR